MSNLTPVDPRWPLEPHKWTTLQLDFPTKFGCHIGHAWAVWPLLETDWPLHNLWPKECITLRLWVLPTKFGCHIGHAWAVWPLLETDWPLHNLWPKECITLRLWVLPTKFGGHLKFLKQLDPWMTIYLWWGRFEKLLSSLGSVHCPHSFSFIPRSTTKRMAVHIPGSHIRVTAVLAYGFIF